MTGYNERLAWLNRHEDTLPALYRQVHPHSRARLEMSAAMTTDALKAAVLDWAEGPGRAQFEAFRQALDAVTGNGDEDGGR